MLRNSRQLLDNGLLADLTGTGLCAGTLTEEHISHIVNMAQSRTVVTAVQLI